MDGFTILIGVAVFVISALMIYCISAFSMREKTFEEVMEEQRQRLEEEREKAKAEKKAEKEQHKKKQGKKGKQDKVKEKSTSAAVAEQVEPKMVNLEIEPEIIEPTESLGLGTQLRQRGKKDKATKSILHNREEIPPVAEKTVEVRHKVSTPKDELELKKTHEKVVVERVEKMKVAPTEAAVKEKKKEFKDKGKHSSEIKENLPPKKSEESSKDKPSKQALDDVDRKSSKTKSMEDATLNGTRLISSVKTAKLSEMEVQTLIEILLNRQGLTSSIPEASSESWNKKSQKGDPVLLLKKQLEEKERALQEEQSMAMAANARVKELKHELVAERSKNAGLEKQFEEKLSHQQSEVEALHQRMHHSHEQHIRESNTLQARIRQFEQGGGDRAALQKLTDENKTLQDALNLKSQETVKLNENAKNLEKQLAASVSKMQNIEVNKKTVEAKVKSYEDKIQKLESAQKDVDSLINQRMEEVGGELRKSENKNATLMSDLQNATSALTAAQGEVSTLKGKLHELEEHLNRADANKEFERKCSDLEGNVKNLNKQLADVSQRLKEKDTEMRRLQQENKHLSDENKTITEKLQSAPASNGDIHGENGTSLSLEEHERILSAKSAELSELTSTLESQKKATSNVQVQLDTKAAELEDLRQQLAQQKVKNNELREKNWKAMEALNETEKASAEKVEKALKSARDLSSQGSAEIEKYDKAVFLRLFPDVHVSDKLSHKEWVSTLEKQAAKKMSSGVDQTAVNQLQEEKKKLQAQLSASEMSVKELKGKADRLVEVEKECLQLKSSKSSQVDSEKYSELESTNSRLKSEVDKYRSIVSETESKVRELEKSIDAREKNWQEKLKEAQAVSLQGSDSSKRVSQLETLLTEQESQMQEYRRVLAQTESSLTQVESKVASQEKDWKEKLESSQSELNKTRTELTSLKQELSDSTGSQEMTAKVENLEKELKDSQDKIIVLTKEKETVRTKVVELESRISSTNSADTEKELTELRSQLVAEKKKSKDLSLNVVKLNGIIKTGQDALSEEQGLVRKLQEQLDSKSLNSGMTETDEIEQATPTTDNGTSV